MKKTIILTCLALVILLVASTSSFAGTPIGKYCFGPTSFSDMWVWSVESMGNGNYSVTGINTVYPSAMTGGGGMVSSSVLQLAVTETEANGRRAIHAIILNLSTLTGTDDVSYHNPDGTSHTTYDDLAISQKTCPSSINDVPEGPAADK